MKFKTSLLALLFVVKLTNAQVQTAILKSPDWNVFTRYDSKFGSSLNLSNNTLAMVVSKPNTDFAIINLDQKLAQNWLTPLNGYPLAIGKFKNNILVVAAADKSFFKNFSGAYKAYLLEEKTGKLLSEKVIYDSNPSFIEQPEFFFANDGSYFRMSVRLTSMKRKTVIFSVSTSDKDYRSTQGYSIINFDDQLNQREKINPIMPPGETWTSCNSTDGSLFIAAVDKQAGVINTATYIYSSAEPLKTVSIPIGLRKKTDILSIQCAPSSQSLTNYLGVVYTNEEKEIALLTAKISFKDGVAKTTKEVFDKKHVKALEKSFVPVNKKFDDLDFSKLEFLGIKELTEYGDKLLVSLAPSYFVVPNHNGTGGTFDHSVLINVYDQELKQLYHQFIPRRYMSLDGEGSKIAFSLKGDKLRILANMRTSWISGVTSLFGEMNFTTGQMLRFNKIPDNDIKSGHYVNTESVSWGDQSCILPYFDKQRILSTKLSVQIQSISY